MKKGFRNLIATALIAVMPLGVMASASATTQTFNNGGKGCTVEEVAPKTDAFTIGTLNGQPVATTNILVKGSKTCLETVSVASWNAPFGSSNFQPYASQVFV